MCIGPGSNFLNEIENKVSVQKKSLTGTGMCLNFVPACTSILKINTNIMFNLLL